MSLGKRGRGEEYNVNLLSVRSIRFPTLQEVHLSLITKELLCFIMLTSTKQPQHEELNVTMTKCQKKHGGKKFFAVPYVHHDNNLLVLNKIHESADDHYNIRVEHHEKIFKYTRL